VADRLGTEVIRLEAGRSDREQSRQLIVDELEAGRPLIAFNLHGQWNYDLIVGFDGAEDRVFYQNWKSGYVKPLSEWTRHAAWRLLALRGYAPRWNRRMLELEAITDMVVRPRHPLIPGG
jgi:hypothetical protein